MKVLSRVLGSALVLLVSAVGALADPLPSWNDTPSRTAIVDFVSRVTDPASPDFVAAEERLAVFDNDGTLWSEKPVYFQVLFALEKVRERAAADPSILTSDALKAAAEGDVAGVVAGGVDGLVEVLDVSHANISVDDFQAAARDWLTTQKHPTSGLTYAQMTYQPMLELLSYLRDSGFRTYIVSGGGIDFIRAVSKDAYGIPADQVIGSEGALRYEVRDGKPVVLKDGGISFVDDKAGKPVGIQRALGARPIFAAGNSDGDFEMLEWTTSGDGPRFGLIVHHTDAEREFAYDRDSEVGNLSAALDQAGDRGWTIVDMAKDWNRVWSVR